MKRLVDLRKVDNNFAHRINMRQLDGTLTRYIDDDGYVCYDEKEVENWKPKKKGRKQKIIYKENTNG